MQHKETHRFLEKPPKADTDTDTDTVPPSRGMVCVTHADKIIFNCHRHLRIA